MPCTDQNSNKTAEKESETPKTENNSARKVVISAPAATITSVEKHASLPDAVQAAASAALAAEKREKEKSKEIKLASKSSILANKKKMSNVLSMWKQRSHEGQAPRVALDDGQSLTAVDDRQNSIGTSLKPKSLSLKENANASSAFLGMTPVAQTTGLESSDVKPRPVSNSTGGTIMGVIRGSGRGVVKSDTVYSVSSGPSTPISSSTVVSTSNSEAQVGLNPFKTDVSALGTYTPAPLSGSGKRRFSETPLSSASVQKEQHQATYRDRAAERRRMYGSASSYGDDDLEAEDPSKL